MAIEITMPALSPTMEEGILTRWLVAEGDTIEPGSIIAEIETDKATMEVESIDEGVLAKILVPGGTEGVKVNTPIAILLEDDEDESALDGFSAGGSSAPAPTPEKAAETAPATKAEAPKQAQPKSADNSDRIKASPLAKRIAKDKGLDLSTISGSGPNGRIIKVDVVAAKPSEPKAAPQVTAADPDAGTEVGAVRSGGAEYLEKLGIPAGTYDLQPLDGMRRVIAKRLTESFRDVPHFPLNVDCEIDDLLAMRKDLNAQAPEGVKVSVNDMLIRACAIALKQVPAANASFTPDGIAMHKNADIAVAVAIDGGSITPIVRAAENKGLSTISAEMKDLAGRARERKLKPQEFQGGTFSLSNLGMMGIKSFASIINQPQGMIMSVGAGEQRPVVKDGDLAVATVMSVTLTCDHRVVDGALGAKWLQHFKRYVEQPITMML